MGQIVEISGVILFIVGLCVCIVGTIISNKKTIPKFTPVSHPVSHPIPQDEAIKILRNRYAKAEVTKEQFEQMKKDLEK